MEPAAGTIVATRYRLDRALGQGGMGAVWAATHLVTGKTVALKFLSDQAGDESAKHRLLREARAACSVSHPNVVQVHDVLEQDNGFPVLVMDLLKGESLGERLEREGKIGSDELVRLAIPLVSALEAAHARGIVHRDIKPDNVFLAKRPDGGVDLKVLDFGIAKVIKSEAGAETAKLTGTGAMMGTPYYMAPEQVFGEKDLDARTDLWAVGILLYECLTGVRPTEGANLGQILKLVTVGPFRPLAEVAPDLPPSLVRVVDACLERDRDKRIASALALREALERFQAGTTFDGAEVPLVAAESARPVPAEAPSDVRPRRAMGRYAVGAAALLVIGSASVYQVTRGARNASVVAPAPSETTPRASTPAPPASSIAPAPTAAAPVPPEPPSNATAAAASAAAPPPARDLGGKNAGRTRPSTPTGARTAPASDRGAGGVVEKPPF